MVKNNEKLYKGRAGQLFVMSLLLAQGWNVAIPEVDTGDDVFVVNDNNGEFKKVQVKTTYTIIQQKEEYFKVKFNIPGAQLLLEQSVELIYAFVVLKASGFYPGVMLIESSELENKLSLLNKKIASRNINFYLEFVGEKVFSQSLDLTYYLNNYSFFPSQF